MPPTLRANWANVASKEWGNEQPQFSCFLTRAAVGLRNSSRVVVHWQAGWVVTTFTVDGDFHWAWQFCVLFRPHGNFGGIWGQSLFLALLHANILRPCSEMSVCCQSPRTLGNVWPDLNQKQTLSLSVSSIYHRCWSILFSQTLYLPWPDSRSSSVPGMISFGSQMFLSAPSFEVWGRSGVTIPFAHFCGCFGGQHTVGPGPRSHAGRG